ncbi:Cytochrome c553 [Noviherbaspirillum humi]|uniref:Cytochrome c553 n=1 Tax=Noviherbaspirillum humi TaxID=1688639 RepID=A0A239LZV2_9BURK|nr:c-type cytochrome [Noviherbaspirillum humi]SNT35418.1 Cytochrome c553 [Noviherbaspirillum humi]
MAADKHVRVLAALLLLGAAAPPAGAADGGPGANPKLGQCFTCHGRDGLAKVPDAPNLAGQNESYLVKALTDYKSGARKHEVMSMMAAPLSTADIADAAAYFSGIAIEVKAK